MNAIDLKWLEQDYPGISDPDQVGAWVESARNLQWLCTFHHIGDGGVHVLSSSDFEAERYVRGLIGLQRLARRAFCAVACQRKAARNVLTGSALPTHLQEPQSQPMGCRTSSSITD